MTQQVSVFLENKPGRLEKVTAVLKEQHINIRAITVSTSPEGWGILNMLVDQPEKAREVLSQTGHPVALREILVVEITDRPGVLHDLLFWLKNAGINVQNTYGAVLKRGQAAVLALDVDDLDRATALLAEHGLAPLADEQVAKI
jgi:hypothetical protein